ncbi:hypothetical protein LINPERHAP1_LOCUS21717 [Linum perenne]
MNLDQDAYRRKNGYFYYWKLEGKQLKGRLKKLTSDQDVLDMGASILMVGQVVDVYLSTEASYEEALMHCHVLENSEKDTNGEEEVMNNKAQESFWVRTFTSPTSLRKKDLLDEESTSLKIGIQVCLWMRTMKSLTKKPLTLVVSMSKDSQSTLK